MPKKMTPREALEAGKQLARDVFGKTLPRSLCTCGHTGDGEHSMHRNVWIHQPGHGDCGVPGCRCRKFTWSRFMTVEELGQKKNQKEHVGNVGGNSVEKEARHA